jgi:hypothetical protein
MRTFAVCLASCSLLSLPLFAQESSTAQEPSASQVSPERGQPVGQAPGGQLLDRGIVIRPAGGNMCGSIVSYNFSAGPNPQLMSVTTCTPTNTIILRRTEKPKGKQPLGPQMVKTNLVFGR